MIFKDMYPDNIVSVGRKKAFTGKMESLRFELQATPFIEDTWHEQPLVDGSAEDGKKKVFNWSSRVERDHFPKLVPGDPLLMQCLRILLEAKQKRCYLRVLR